MFSDHFVKLFLIKLMVGLCYGLCIQIEKIYKMRELLISKVNVATFAKAFLFFAVLFGFNYSAFGQCPNIQIVDLRGTPGFPQTDDLNVCGNPDTLSLLVFTDDPGEIKGFEMTVNMVSGMRYAGFEETHYGGCTSLSNSDPDLTSPQFIAGGITCGDIFVANIGITADCSVDKVNNDYLIEVDYKFIYFPPTGGSIKCKGTQVIDNDFNGAMKVSVLNMSEPDPVNAQVSTLGPDSDDSQCQTFEISQDGLQAYISEFEFAVCGLPIGGSSPISITSMTANGIDIYSDAIYNAVDTSLTVTINETHFPFNTSTNPLGTPEQMDTNEKVNFKICYEVANCPDGGDIPFSYKAWYGCFDEDCQQTGQGSFMKIEPEGSLAPEISAMLSNTGITICGEDAEVTGTIRNPNSDTEQNVYTDLSIGFQACGMEALQITEVIINGESVPAIFNVIGDDVDIDFSMNENPDIGLVDYDGDEFFDDLPGGSDILNVTVKFNLGCGTGSEGGCPEINCDNVQFYLKGKTNCGNAFQAFPSTGGFDLQYGQEAVTNIGEVDLNSSGSVVGYNFGSYSSMGGPVGSEPEEIEIQFCYGFAKVNVEDCPSGGETKMVAHFGGPDFVINDLDFVPGSVMIDSTGTGYEMVDDLDVSYTIVSPGISTFEINNGSNSDTLCYKYKLRLDECHCGPNQYIALNQQIVSVCSDCDPDCEIVKGCRPTLIAANPECSPCDCPAEYVNLRTERKNFGYIDKEMTRKITRDELADDMNGVLDLARFMPGDTLWHQGYWEIKDAEIMADPIRWLFRYIPGTLGGTLSSGEAQAALPLVWDGGAIDLTEMRIENPDGEIYIVDITELESCATGGSSKSEDSFRTHFNTPWGDHPGDEHESTYSCSYNAWEGYDNQLTDFGLWNFDRMEEVNQTNPNIATRHGRGEGDCLDEFLETYEIIVGSRIYLDWCVPLIKNPLREQAKIIGFEVEEQTQVRIVPYLYTYAADEIAGSSLYGYAGSETGCCSDDVPCPVYSVSCPGGLKSETNINLDVCGGTIEHEFVVEDFAGPPGDEWFTLEYRPLIEIHDLELPIISPLAYCANARVMRNGQPDISVTVDSTYNMKCSPVAGYSDQLCAVDSLSEGYIVFDLFEQGITGLGIGLDNCDTIRLVYDYCMICPAPLEGVLDYQMKVDWCTQGQPTDCAISAMTYYDSSSNTAPGGSETLLDEAVAAGFTGAAHNVNYYDLFMLDTLYCKMDDVEGIVFINPDPLPLPMSPVTAELPDGQELIASGSAGTSVEVKEVKFCNPDPLDATGFSGYVTVPNAVEFKGACLSASDSPDDPPTLNSTLVSDDGQVKKYLIEMPSDVLLGGIDDCVSVFIKTTLLFCPSPGSIPPEICVGASSGCSPDEVRAAIGGGGTCSSSEVCYAYIFGEADLQTEWFGLPSPAPQLCETFYLNVRTKNVKELLLLEVSPNFTLPFGMSVVPDSWEVAFPGGSVEMMGNFGTWTSVDDPDVVSGFNYSWSDQSIWSSEIDMNGLPGVSDAGTILVDGVEVSADSNKVAFRFQVTTNCNEFLSGSKPSTETTAADPCGPGDLSSGDVESLAIIIDGANPADHAQLLTVASPSELFCGGLTNTFGLTALNISDVATTDSVITCFTIPIDVLTYTPGSAMFSNGFTPAWVTETMIGDQLQVCVHSPAIAVGESWSLSFEASMNEDAPCGDIFIGADVKSVVEAVSCDPGPPDECDVFVQNSINPGIFVELKAPLETTDLRASVDCSMGDDPVQVCYEIDLVNPGPAYSGNVNVAIFDDVTGNGIVDSFDGVLNEADHAVSLAFGESTTIMMCLDVASIQSCPIVIKQTYDTDCACDFEETPVMDLKPKWFADLEECLVLCPTEPFILETCGDYELTFDPVAGVAVTDDGMGNLTILINDGFGIDAPVIMSMTGTTGECSVSDSRQLKSIGAWVPEDQTADICENDCVDLDLMIPSDLIDGATITWTPTLGLDDATIDNPEVCGLTGDQVYDVEIKFGDACIFNIEYTVNYIPNGVTTITGEEFCLCQEAGVLTGAAGFSSYEWYSIQSGAEILEFIGTSNTWNGPTEPGDYFLKAYLGGAICPNISNVVTLVGKECVDLELTKEIINIPTPLVLGSQVTYQIQVCNIQDEDLGLKYDATNVEISDELPGAITYVQHTQTSGNYSPTTNQWDISTLANGTCETLLIDVTLDEVGSIENTAQISGSDNEDIDSEENNDDGDQSEDDEDAAVIELACETVSGEIFYDLNSNGCEDADEQLVTESINVSLYECGDVPGTDAPAAITTVTDGMYEFGPESQDVGANLCLLPGTSYFVVFDIPNSAGEALEDYTFSSGTADATCEASGEADDVNPANGSSTCYDPTDADATDGDSDNSIDAGITPPCYELAGEIFYDNNDNGCQDSGEGLVMEDIEVSLYECGDVPGVDQPQASTIVSDGQYEFGEDSDDVGADFCLENNIEYFVVFDIPNASGEALEDYEFSNGQASGACAVAGESDNVDPVTGASGCYDPDNDDSSDGDDDQNIDAGITPPCHEIAGEIFYDMNDNGCQDGVDALVMEPISVSLFVCGADPAVDSPIATTAVSDGAYEFGEDSTDPGADVCLDAGTQYFVVFDIPNGAGETLEGYEFSSMTASPTCEAAGESDDVDSLTGQSGCYDPDNDDGTDGAADQNIDAGIAPPCHQLAGEIFYDGNNDGCQDASETLVMEAVNVTLYECGDNPGIDPPVASTTVTDGSYEFGEDSTDSGADVCLDAGTQYFVVFDIPNGAGEALEDYEFSSGAATGTCSAAGESDDVDPSNGQSGCYDPDNSDSSDGDSDQNIDAGITPPCEQISGEIFYDNNDNGCQDAGETLVMEAINVSLFACGDDPATATPVASTTVADGMYTFGETSDDSGADVCLDAGTQYFVVFDIPNAIGEALEDHSFSSGAADATCEAAGESDDVNPLDGSTACVDPSNTDGGDGDSDENLDAGIVPPCENIAGEIFYDGNDDGCQDASETLVMEAVNVTLYECGDNPAVDQPLASTTVTDGAYEFGMDSDDAGANVCLTAGTEYFVVFDIPNATGEALEDYTFSSMTSTGACATSGDSDNVDPSNGESACLDPNDDDTTDGDDDNNVDAGIVPPCEQLGGEIFYDGNENGCQDAAEMLVNVPVTVTLFACGDDPATATPVASTTVSDGMYAFGETSDDPGADVCLESGTQYFVLFDIPNGVGEDLEDYTFSSGTASPACEVVGESDDVNPATGASGCYDPNNDDATDGNSDENIDAGIVPPCEQIAGEIFYDLNDNGCQDMGETLVMEAINVSLFECGDDPSADTPVASTTVMDGDYTFGENSTDSGADVCLDAGIEYFVVFDIPNGSGEALQDHEFSSGATNNACTALGQSDDVNPSTGATGCVDPSNNDGGDGDADENLDAGIVPPCYEIAGEIFYDDNDNGCEDSDENLVTGSVTVSLFECGADPSVDAPAAVTMVVDGSYEFGENSDDPGADICLQSTTEYFVVFSIPNGPGDALEGYDFSTGDAGSSCEAAGESDDVNQLTGQTGCVNPQDDDAVDGDDDQNLDAGIVAPCQELAGEIFYDYDNNGCQDMGEPLVMEAVEVSLYQCGDIPGVDPPFANTTVSNGEYEFGEFTDDPGADVCLEAGVEYFVVFGINDAPGQPLEDHSFSSNTASGSCAIAGDSDDVDPTTGASGCYDPDNNDENDGDDDQNIDAGIVPPCETLGGEIFYDNNENGCQDGDEPLVMEVVTISLFECGMDPLTDAPLASTSVTDGDFEFSQTSTDPGAALCLTAGSQYFLVFDLPNQTGEILDGYEFTPGNSSLECAIAGESDDVDPNTGMTGCYDPNNENDPHGGSDEHIDAGIVAPCESIAGEIFYDGNENGCQDPMEMLVLETINVSLYECGDVPGVDQPIASTSVSDGMYEFGPESDDAGADECLEAGTEYFVVFDIPNADGEALEDYEFTEGVSSGACASSDASDNVDPTTGASGCVDPSDSDSGDGNDDENVDAGITPPCEQVAGEVFYDNNANGCQDAGETLVTADVNVTLYECGAVPGTDAPVASTTTIDGMYSFGENSMNPGADVCLDQNTSYFVVFDIPNGAGAPLEGYEFTEGTAGVGCAAAGESDDVNSNTGQSVCYDPNNDDVNDGGHDEDIDAGITAPCQSIAGEIFYDGNENGCQDPMETLVMETINVSLYECGDLPGVDEPIASTSVSDGMYEFGVNSDDAGADECLVAGTEYFVVFDIPNATGESLEDYEFTEGVSTGACATSGDSDNVDPTTGASGCVDPDNNDSGDGNDDENVDAGIVPPCEQVAGEVFYDDNANGCQDAGESLVTANVNVTLYECGAVVGIDAPVASTTTIDGMYSFGENSMNPDADVCLDQNTSYFVVFDIPNGVGEDLENYTFTDGAATAACESIGESDDVDPSTGQSGCYDPNNDDSIDGTDDENIDAGITAPCESLAGEIFYDTNENGCQDSGESLVTEAIEVSLYACGATPGVDQPLASTTVTDGQYEFGPNSNDTGADECLEAGTEYFVVFDIPNGNDEVLNGYEFTEGISSGACATSGQSDNVDSTNGASGCYDPSDSDSGDGDDDNDIDAGITPPCESVAGEIFYDGNDNGCQDGNESLVMEVINVTLYECGSVPGTDAPVASTSVFNGEYMFGMGSDDPGADVCLEAGTGYFVVFDIPMGPGQVLDGFEFTEGTASQGCEIAGMSDDVDPTTGMSGCYDADNDDGTDGASDENIDVGISPPCEQIAGEIFYDDNNNGCQDANEPLVDDQTIEVVLYQCGDIPGLDQPAAFTSVTDGQYVFGVGSGDPGADICLEAGDEYFVSFHIPNGPGEALEDYYFSENIAAPSCLFSGEGDNIDPTTGMSSCHDPSNTDDDDGDADENIDAGIMHPCEEIAGEIFYDENNNGCQDAEETLVMEAVEVSLYSCDATPGVDTPVASTTTTTGEYQFGDYSVDSTDDPCLNPRLEYFVVFDFDNGEGDALDSYYFSDGDGASCAGTSDTDDTDPYTGESVCVDPDNVDDDMDVDAGITPCEEIAGEVYYDWNADGCQDPATETGVEGVDVYIFSCSEALADPSNALASTSTDVDGAYTFGPEEIGSAEVCLHPDSTYYVMFDLPNADGELHDDFYLTDGEGAACAGSDNSDDVDPETGLSTCYDPNDDDGTDSNGDENVDAGITPCETLGGEVFYDWNGDGCQDGASEGPVADIEVSIYSCSETNPGPGNALATDVTNADGEYLFGPEETDGGHLCLHPDSSYYVVFNVPNAAGEAFDDFSLTEGDGASCAGGDTSDDVDPETGQSLCHDPNDDDAADGNDDENIDAGLIPCEEIAGEVYFDWNQNGCQDGPAETGAEGVNVYVYECGESNPTPGNALASDVTDADGAYTFGAGEDGNADICLSADKQYFVVFDIPNGVDQAYEGFNFTEGDGASCAGTDAGDDIDPLTGMSSCYDPSDDDDDNDIDAGIEGCLDMGGTVFFDMDGDGCQDAALDTGAADVNVYLYNCEEGSPTAENALASDVTDVNGDYLFGPAEDGSAGYCLHMDSTYYVVFDLPNGDGEVLEGYNFTEGAGTACAGGPDADDVNSTTGQSDCYDPMDDGDTDDGDNDVDAGIAVYDLALTKITKPTDPVQVGDEVCFTIEVFNQGTLPAYEVLVNDYIPTGLLLSANDDNGWESISDSHATAIIGGPIMPNASATIDIVMTVQEDATLATMMNVAEVGAFEDMNGNDVTDQDVDSDGDSMSGNDGDMVDDDIDGTDGDEDDSDLAWPPVFDLSLIKYTDHTGPVIPGEIITFKIEVCNQGNIAAQNILLNDYPNTGLTLSSGDTNGWTVDSEGNITLLYTGIIAPAKCETVEVDMEILPGADVTNSNNIAEIGSSEDENGNDMSNSDVDSTSDSDDSNDGVATDDDHNNTNGDEDDHDPEGLDVFDLALRKLIQISGPSTIGDVVRFDIEVCNQGNVTAANVLVSDYIPAGLQFVDGPANNAWDLVNPSLATTTYVPNILPNDCVLIPIYLELISVDPMSLVNMAEISGSTDSEGADTTNSDVDSHADGNNGNDNGNDPFSDLNDLNDGNSYLGDDEDDHDQAWVLTCQEVACKGNLNVSLDETCSVMVTAQMMLSPALFPAEMYTIEITDEYGNIVDNMFEASDIGKSFDVSVCLPLCDDNCCWGTIVVEDKFPPVLDCNAGPFYVPCNGVDQVPAPTAVENCGDHTVILINEVEELYECSTFIGKVTRTYVGVDGAGNESAVPCVQEIYITRPDLSQITAPVTAVYSCNEDFIADANGYPAPWVSPESGSGSGVPILCVQEQCGFTLVKTDSFGDGWNGATMDIVINGVVVETTSFDSGESSTCANVAVEGAEIEFVWTSLGTFGGEIGFQVLDTEGNMLHDSGIGGNSLGTAFSFTQDCPGDGFNTGVACHSGPGAAMSGVYMIPGPQDQVCNTFVSYEDTPLPQIGCTQKIMRRFEVREWWCGGELTWAGTQFIEITDDEGPAITCPAPFTVTTDNGCNGEVELPAITPVDGCGYETHVNITVEGKGVLGEEGYFPGAFLETNGGEVTLPVGPNIVTYVAYDECYNSSSCTMVVTVADMTQPVAICESNTVVSIPSSGNVDVWAQTFDDGSFDECGVVAYEVTRMESECNPEDVTVWDDLVSFCCADVGMEVMIAFRVTDASGNSNICMTTVTVQDKVAPSITCPADMTITCVEPYDLGNLSAFFGSPEVDDNCTTDEYDEAVDAEINTCGTGTITRDFTISDANGVVVASCQQVITVMIDELMTEDDIIWPADEEFSDICNTADAHPDIIGYPVIIEGVCDQVGFNYEDEVFENIPGSAACAKILRSWQVLNWCQKDADGNFEIWEHVQVIELFNTVDPVITGSCEKIVATSNDPNCSDVFVSLTNSATDDCTPAGALTWTWTIDVDADSDASNDISGTGNDASGEYPIGEHIISWTVTDLCGNFEFCDQQISVVNTKGPTAVCIYGLSSELIPMDIDLDGTADTEMVTLWASDFDAESNHPCGYDVFVSFSADINDTFISFGCNQLGVQAVDIWVTDINGGVAICETFVTITNNVDEGLCDNFTEMVVVEGRVATETDKEIESVHVNLEGSNLSDMTDLDGEYSFPNMPMGGAYKVKPTKNDDLLNGVTTLDIIFIQRHILELTKLATPYQYVAADINKSGSISAIDLIELRKAILGVKDEFTNNQSWRFIDEAFEFDDNVNPLAQNFTEDYNIPALSNDMLADFVGVKIGDVNGSVEVSGFASDELETRSSNVLRLEGTFDGSQLIIKSSNTAVLRGMQMTIEYDKELVNAVSLTPLSLALNADSYYINEQEGYITMTWNVDDVLKVSAGEELFAITLDGKVDPSVIEISSLVTKAEAYNKDFEIMEIGYDGGSAISEIALLQNEPNPWVSKTSIEYVLDAEEEVTFIFRDGDGKLIKKITQKGSLGNNILELNASELNAKAGVIYYEMQTQTDRIMKKMILLH